MRLRLRTSKLIRGTRYNYVQLANLIQFDWHEHIGVEIRGTPVRTEVIIKATRSQNVAGEKGRRIRELTSVMQKRFDFPQGQIALFAEQVQNRALCAIAQAESVGFIAQAESVQFKLLEELPVRRACYDVLRYIMDNGAQGVEIIVLGKLRAQRAAAMKFKDGYVVKSVHAARVYIDKDVRHVHIKHGMLGINVKIHLQHDPTGVNGVTTMSPELMSHVHCGKSIEMHMMETKGGSDLHVVYDEFFCHSRGGSSSRNTPRYSAKRRHNQSYEYLARLLQYDLRRIGQSHDVNLERNTTAHRARRMPKFARAARDTSNN